MSQGFHRRLARHILLDLTPLRRSRDYRALISGLGISVLGNQLTTVAVPFQVYAITRSSLVVGLVSLAQLFPLIFGSLLGGSLVDAVDRRKLLIVVEAIGAASSAGLALNADVGPALWPLFVFPAVNASLSGIDSSARNAMLPGMVGMDLLPSSNAIFQSMFQTGAIVGPAVAGLLLAGAGVHWIYWIDAVSFLAALTAAVLIAPQPPSAAPGSTVRPGWRSTLEGLRFVRRTQPVLGAYAIDLNAMVFGMPRALFPALAATVFGGGATTVGLLYSAPGAGALLGALTSGWVGRVRRQGLAVIAAVLVWGAAITGFGIVRWLPAALVLLAVAGWADVLSAVFRNTMVQFAGPDGMRGRLMGVQMAVVAGGPRLGDLEAGAVANAFGDTVSVVSGGLACIAGALLVAWSLPGFTRARSGLSRHAAEHAGEPAVEPE
ncbi:MFS transporter [Trebonia kvetii]|uniref:MFS transporter n=1 Tax=Trebonia kvetii TaxID=2480626 RepID=A0A6P2BR15_9ACTN|nr:MFS transporter [Trebonia kvetii]TVZ01107.1 MFS transporter [Trebonia kvetii]